MPTTRQQALQQALQQQALEQRQEAARVQDYIAAFISLQEGFARENSIHVAWAKAAAQVGAESELVQIS